MSKLLARCLLPITLCAFAFVPAAAGVPGATITITAHDLKSGATLPAFTYLVNVDNAHDPADPDPLKRPSLAPTESHSPVVALGDQSSASLTLPDGRYLISVRSPDHKLWGKHITLPRDAGEVRVDLLGGPLPLGKVKIQVFHDDHWVNNAYDEGEAGLAGFHVTLEEQTHSQVTVDYFNHPLCGGDCVTGPDGTVTIDNLAPGTYFAAAIPPNGSSWVQDSTFDGGFEIMTNVEEGSDGTGAPGEAIWEGTDNATAYWFGFVKPMDFATPGAGSISGRAVNWVGWPPFDQLVTDTNEPVRDPYVALSNSATDEQVYLGRGDADGNFSIAGVPDGTYTLSIWDEQLTYIIRFVTVTVTGGQAVDLGEVGVSRWFGWLEGTVYMDENKNGVQDPGEPPIPNTDLDQRWRDGSIKDGTFTDANGHYVYPLAEGGPLGKIFIGEQGFSRFGVTGASVHDEYDPTKVTHVPTDLGGALLTNQQVTEGHRSIVDWGKYTYGNEPGQIVGITYYATTRNEFDARFQAHEDYEPAIPDVQVNLEGLGPDGQPNTADDTLLNVYVTDHWSHSKNCDVRDFNGNPLSSLNPLIGPNCLEVPITGNETKDGAFDGGYAFADYCPSGYDEKAPDVANLPCWNAAHDGHLAPAPLVAGTYITHVVMPTGAGGSALYRIVGEEDVNVDLGASFVPAIPPPPCTGDMHVVHIDPATNPRSPYDGRTMPRCDKRLVVLQNKQNANADFFLMTNFTNGVDVAPAGRILGHISDDIYFDRDRQSIWYGEPRPIANVPVGIRDFTGRLLVTVNSDMNGDYEALLPSTETFNCPIPQGPCPGMYVIRVNDPGDKGHPNANYSPNYLIHELIWDVWPGLTSQLDTPLDPIAGAACELATGEPELLQVSTPYVNAGNRRVTLLGDFFGTLAGQVTLDDPRAGEPTTTLTVANGGIVSWSDRQIVIDVPAGTSPAPKQLLIEAANGIATASGITLHVLGAGYDPPVVPVGSPTNPHAIQEAIDGAGPGSLLVLQPGIYRENVILPKPLVLQGLGPGGIVGARELLQRQPEEPRINILGTTIDGRYYRDNLQYWETKLHSLTWSGNQEVSRGAIVTVVAKDGDFTGGLGAARIDGIDISLGQGDGGAGGVQVNAYARNLHVTNTTFESDGGTVGGGINLGVPYQGSQHNENVVFEYNRVLSSGGLMRGGGMTIFNGADNYEIANNTFCSNFSVEYGAGISHWGLSPGGKIHDNKIYYNQAVDSGAGISIQQETPQPLADGTQILGNSSGNVVVERNLLNSNYSGDDGGGIYVKRALGARIDIRNNMIVDNGAAHMGGGVALVDASNVAIVNDTIARNVTTSTFEGTDGKPHGAGLAADANSDLFQATLPAGSKDFSDPKALYNDIFWQNDAQTLDTTTAPPTLVSQGFRDFEVFGSTATFTPRNSLLTSAYGTGVGNIVGQDPQFVTPFDLPLVVGPSRGDPQAPSVDIYGGEDTPPPLQGDYHIARTSPAVDAGVSTDGTTAAPTDDYDRDTRPQGPKWDFGADEVFTPPTLAAVRIDVGGAAFTTADGRAFIADKYFTGGTKASYPGAAIKGTSDRNLYRDERWGDFSYAIPVANGKYDVKLHFIEMYYAAPCIGKRLFSIDVGDTTVSPDVANLDICAAAGGPNTALVKTIGNVTVSDGHLNLKSIYGSLDDPELAAIEIVAAAGAPAAPTVTVKKPADGTTNVAVGEQPSAVFSTAMTASTITSSSFTLKAGATAVAASVAYDAATRTATLTPKVPLVTATTYTATLATTIKSSDGTPLAAAVSWTFTTAPPPTVAAIRIDVAGVAYTAADGRAFIADKYFTGGTKASYPKRPIAGTGDPNLYRDERWGDFSYAIPVPNGTYDVKLHFVELYYAGPCIGKRVFSIDVGDTGVTPDILDLDICAAAGGPNTALVKTIGNVTVSDGFLNLQAMYGSLDDPELAAIEVIPR